MVNISFDLPSYVTENTLLSNYNDKSRLDIDVRRSWKTTAFTTRFLHCSHQAQYMKPHRYIIQMVKALGPEFLL